MSEDILSRARLLAKAANDVADQMSLQVDEYKAVIQARKADEAKTMAIENEKKSNHERSRTIGSQDVGQQKFVKGAAICGSALVTTYEDIRPFAPRGAAISIDNIRCKLKQNGEWTANRIELEVDYPGETNLDAQIGAMITAEIVKKRSPKKNKATPIASSDISGAVANLDIGNLVSSRTTITDKKKPKKPKPPNQSSSSVTDSLSEYSRALLSDQSQQQQSSRPVIHQPQISVHVSDHHSHSRFDAKPPLHQTTLSSFSKPTSSPSARSILSTSSKVSRHSTLSITSSSASVFASQPPPLMTGSEIIATDENLEPEQIQMLNEIDDITPEEQQRRRYEMNLRMADRGQQKAVERVEKRRQLESLKEESAASAASAHNSESHSVFSSGNDSQGQGHGQGVTVASDEYLSEQRRLAFQRVSQKRQEEDRLIAERLKREEEERAEYRKLMEEKAEKLKQLTAKRVADYKAMKKEKERKKREAKEAEEALKREREMECQSELYLKRLQQRMVETEARLQKQKRELEDRKYLERVEIESKLSDIALQRHRTKDIVSIALLPSDSTSGDVERARDDQSKASNGSNNSKLPRVRMKRGKGLEASGGDPPQDETVKVSIQTKPAHFLPGIRTSTSEQSNRSTRKNSTVDSSSSALPPRQPNGPHNRIDRHRSANPSAPVAAAVDRRVMGPPPVFISNTQQQQQQQQQRSETADELDGYLSDDSLQDKDRGQQQQRQLRSKRFPDNGRESLSDYLLPTATGVGAAPHASRPSQFPPSSCSSFADNATVVSALTTDTNLQSFPNQDGGDEMKTKKKKRKVWKMEPIPIRPYVQVPAASNG